MLTDTKVARPPNAGLELSELCGALAANAAKVDRAGDFAVGSLALLQQSALMGMIVPARFGGQGATHFELIDITQQLGKACLSSAIIFAMHCQQVAVLVHHAPDDVREIHLRRLCREQHFIASVTTELGKGGALTSTRAALEASQDGYELNRLAPIVTGGAAAGAFLITMRRGPDAPQSDTCLVYLPAERISQSPVGEWKALGMRGTGSGGLQLSARVYPGDILNLDSGFQDIAIETMIPFGHFAWSSAWLGAAKGALEDVARLLRDPAGRRGFDFQSDLLWDRLGRVQMKIDSAEAFLSHAANAYGESLARGRRQELRSPRFQMLINGLKVFCSETTFDAVNDLVELVGLRYGYLQNEETRLEQRLRDLRSASLMYRNDRLTTVNGKLCLLGAGARLI
jgi:acyl-CoA dehydrogenase